MKFVTRTNICLKTWELPAQEKHLSVRFYVKVTAISSLVTSPRQSLKLQVV